jgi:mono/diheme cytochrome c family protein
MKTKNLKRLTLTFITFIFINILLSCGGSADNTNKNQVTNTTTTSDNTPYSAGKTIYQKNCITCHQADGKGMTGSFPPLAASDYLLKDKYRAIGQVLKGSMNKITVNGTDYQSVMPPQMLNDSDVALVLNYVYHSFGNNGFTVSAAEVKSVRDTRK